jgi:hypothetical protein
MAMQNGNVVAQASMLQNWPLYSPAQFGVPPQRTDQQIADMGHTLARINAPDNVSSTQRIRLKTGKVKRPLNAFIAFRSKSSQTHI